MPVKKIFVFLSMVMFLQLSALSQDCSDFHLSFCVIPDFTFFYNQQSRSFNMRVGETKELRIIAYENTDYFVSACKHRKFNTLQFRIYEDSETKDLLFDNSTNNYADFIKFANTETRKLIIEISLPPEKNDPEDHKMRCAGILVASRLRKVD